MSPPKAGHASYAASVTPSRTEPTPSRPTPQAKLAPAGRLRSSRGRPPLVVPHEGVLLVQNRREVVEEDLLLAEETSTLGVETTATGGVLLVAEVGNFWRTRGVGV